MFEKVNPSHPDKVADRIAGAIVDLSYKKDQNPKVAVEVLIGHGKCMITNETSVKHKFIDIQKIVYRIAGRVKIDYIEVPQDVELAKNQEQKIKCGDNGIFKGSCINKEEQLLTDYVKLIYRAVPYDGKYIIRKKYSDTKNYVSGNNISINCLTIDRFDSLPCQKCNYNDSLDFQVVMCQSHIDTQDWKKQFPNWIINPLGDWTGGINVDTGATNRKLGSDMGRGVTGGGLHGKDLSKADVALNIYCHLKAQELGRDYELSCVIGDSCVDGKPYSEIVKIVKEYIDKIGGFEKFAEWGLIR